MRAGHENTVRVKEDKEVCAVYSTAKRYVRRHDVEKTSKTSLATQLATHMKRKKKKKSYGRLTQSDRVTDNSKFNTLSSVSQ